jgi:hypothetical protein
VDPLSGCWPHWEKQLAAARREGVIEGLTWTIKHVVLHHDIDNWSDAEDAIRAEIERLREEKP